MAREQGKRIPQLKCTMKRKLGSLFLSFFLSFFLSLFSEDKKSSKVSKVTVMNRKHYNAMQCNATWMDEEGEECH